jgi:hypothetical protein
MDPSESLAKPTNPFSEKRISMHKIKYIDIESTIYVIDCITKETNYAEIQISKY